MSFTFSPCMFAVAKHGYRETCEAAGERDGKQAGAHRAIVFGMVALEGFANEVAGFAQERFEAGEKGTGLEELVGVWEDRAQIGEKLFQIRTALTGKGFETDGAPFQDFDLLVYVRNALVHPRPEEKHEVSGDGRIVAVHWEKFEERCAARKILDDSEESREMHHAHRVATRAGARWACETVVGMVMEIVRNVKVGNRREWMEIHYGEGYQLEERFWREERKRMGVD